MLVKKLNITSLPDTASDWMTEEETQKMIRMLSSRCIATQYYRNLWALGNKISSIYVRFICAQCKNVLTLLMYFISTHYDVSKLNNFGRYR